MDENTVKYYSANAESISERYDKASGGVDKYFSTAFISGSRVIDIGCGNGRDLKLLLSGGFDAIGIDACAEFIHLFNRSNAEYQGRMSVESLPELKSVEDKCFDGVLCSAVLMHLPEEQLFDACFSIRRILKENGRLLISVPLQDHTVDKVTKRDVHGRLYNGVTPENLGLIFERLGFRLLNRWDDNDSLNRNYRKWAVMLFTLENEEGTRPIDTIESILSNDKKVATYKLALLRALADFAITNYNLAEWRDDGYVKIPVNKVAEKWVEYYWPIFEAEEFISQIQAEDSGGKPVAFRGLLSELIQRAKMTGGLPAFTINLRNRNLPDEIERLYRNTLSKVKNTIIYGPVTHSGGANGEAVFGYEKGYILVPFTIWRELSLMGYWIQDAAILRWAELTSRISKETIPPSRVIDYLLTAPIPERDVYASRSFYDSLKDKECVWSGLAISAKYDIDHAIPFALWKNNDLWNLFPANSSVNSRKKDKLPSNRLIRKRKDCILYYWELIKEQYPARFEYEAEKLTGAGVVKSQNWQNKLFSGFTEAVEITAVQKGIERWEPDFSVHVA